MSYGAVPGYSWMAVSSNTSWKVTSDVPWMSIDGADTGTGDSTVIIHQEENKGAARSGTLIFTTTAGSPQVTWKVTVNQLAAVAVTSVTILKPSVQLVVGSAASVSAVTNGSDKALSWSSNNPAVATLSASLSGSSIVVTGQSAGTATITAKSANGVVGTMTVTVTPKA